MTATPTAYIERNTYRFYQCKDNQPDFTFRIQDAFRDEYLVPYRFASGITRFLEEGVEIDAEHIDPSEFERKWTNKSTNELMMREFDRLAWGNYRDLAPKQKLGPGKAIVYAITKHHATRSRCYSVGCSYLRVRAGWLRCSYKCASIRDRLRCCSCG